MEVNNLDFSFASKNIFKNLSLQIKPQELTVFLGPSGCGKSTLLRIFAGLIENPALVKNSLKASFVFQEANLLQWNTCLKNIMLPNFLEKTKIDDSYFNYLIEKLNIADCLKKYPQEISGGQKMRVSIARALITKPQVLFLDEPFSALDEPTRISLQEELKEIQNEFKMTILFVTHSFFEAVYLADRIIVFSDQKPTQIVHDKATVPNFKTRFDENYQSQVKDLSQLFTTLVRKI